ncbi:MAG TPA: hybrid sensor histidine kinase/response regulator [Anaerolineae bacterium]
MAVHTAESESTPAYDRMFDTEVADFRQRYQRYLLILTSAIAWIATVRYAVSPANSSSNIASLVGLLVAIGSGYLLRRNTALSLTTCLGGLSVAVTCEVLAHPGSPAIYLYASLVVLISAIASTSVLVLSGVAYGLILGLLDIGGYITGNEFIGAGLTLFSVTVCAYIASRPIFDSLVMALNSAHDSMLVRDELREQRRQLAQSVKALDEALYRLGRSHASLIIARQQAEEARQLKVRFANMISHEIRTPLNIIISFSEVIANAPESYGIKEWPANLGEDVNEIYRSGKHLLSLINDVLDLAQVEANRVVLKKERSVVLDVVDQAVSLARKWFDHAGLYLRTEVVGDIPEIQLDRIRIRQVILNLLSNARHYTTTGGITVHIERTVEEIIVSVKDTGLGISSENLQHLFDEFSHLSESVDESIGSGLGLSISRMFIQLHGGRMWAESAGTPGQGTTVSFSLPLPSTPIANDIPPSQRDAEFWQSRYDQARSERVILVASDDLSVLQSASRLFNNQGKIVTSSLGAMTQAFPAQQPDVVMAFTGESASTSAAPCRGVIFPQDLPLLTCRLERNIDTGDRHQFEAQDVNVWLIKPVMREDLASAVLSVAPKAQVVLSVEDDPAMVRFYELALDSDKRFDGLPKLINVTRGADVMHALEEHLPHAILLNLNLADGSGWDVLAAIRARWTREQMPVIVVTAMDRYGSPVLRASEITVKRPQGMSQRETVMCLQNMLEAVLS